MDLVLWGQVEFLEEFRGDAESFDTSEVGSVGRTAGRHYEFCSRLVSLC